MTRAALWTLALPLRFVAYLLTRGGPPAPTARCTWCDRPAGHIDPHRRECDDRE